MPSAVSVVELLAARVRTDGSRPLLTYYHPARGERVEFSATSFANWVDKTANLIMEHLDEGTIVAGPVSVQHPCHWMSLIWPLATWQAGLYYSALPTPPVPEECDIVVVGPEDPQPQHPAVTLACSLHPLGLGLSDLPDDVLDYTTEALAQPDGHWQNPVKYHDDAWFDEQGDISLGGWLELPPQPGRVLVRPDAPRLVLGEALARPLLGGGSAVVVDGPVAEDDLVRIVADERIDAHADRTAASSPDPSRPASNAGPPNPGPDTTPPDSDRPQPGWFSRFRKGTTS